MGVVLLRHGRLEEGCWARDGAQAAKSVHCVIESLLRCGRAKG